MVEKKDCLSPELIIHPGETLKEIIEDREMSQNELAKRTGNSAKHISDVVNCLKPISVNFAKKLEYALNIEASFFNNLQSNYSEALTDFEEYNNISKEEIAVIKKLKKIIQELIKRGYIEQTNCIQSNIINLRKVLNISSLENIPDVMVTGAYRISSTISIDQYILFTWIRMIELIANDINLNREVDIVLLQSKLPLIKSIMFEQSSDIPKKLFNIFEECGIKLVIVQSFKGAPANGVIMKSVDNVITLSITTRNKFADIFWFTLFHEIAHIINGDIKNRLIDFENGKSKMEIKADEFAKNILLDDKKYTCFIKAKDYSLNSIKGFAAENEVKPYIVIGRLQKEKRLNYNDYSQEKMTYDWF